MLIDTFGLIPTIIIWVVVGGSCATLLYWALTNLALIETRKSAYKAWKEKQEERNTHV